MYHRSNIPSRFKALGSLLYHEPLVPHVLQGLWPKKRVLDYLLANPIPPSPPLPLNFSKPPSLLYSLLFYFCLRMEGLTRNIPLFVPPSSTPKIFVKTFFGRFLKLNYQIFPPTLCLIKSVSSFILVSFDFWMKNTILLSKIWNSHSSIVGNSTKRTNCESEQAIWKSSHFLIKKIHLNWGRELLFLLVWFCIILFQYDSYGESYHLIACLLVTMLWFQCTPNSSPPSSKGLYLFLISL